MRKLFFKSMLLLCALIVGSGIAWGTDTYEKINSLAAATTGDYVIVGCKTSSSYGLLTYGTLNSSRIPYTKSYNSYGSLPSTITNPDANSVWSITRSNNTVKIYNANQGKWLTSSISYQSNENNATSFTIVYSSGSYGTFAFNSGTTYLGVNKSADYWKCYASGTLTATNGLTLYKKVSTDPNASTSTTSLTFGNVGYGKTKTMTFTVTPANLTSDLIINCNNSKYEVSPLRIAQEATGEQTITVTAKPLVGDGAAAMNGTISISGGGLASPKTVTLTATPVTMYDMNWSVNGIVVATDSYINDADIVFPDDPEDINGKEFVGWTATSIENPIETDVEPTLVTSAKMGTSDKTYYAVFATASAPVESLSQTLQYDSWTYSGTTTDKTSYRLFAENAYIESSDFNLSKLSKVIVYAGTFGSLASAKKKVYVKSGSTTWGTASLSTNSATTQNNITSSVSLTGTGALHIVAGGGDGSDNGIRISKVEIFITTSTYSAYSTLIPIQKELSADTWASFCPSFDVTIPDGVDVHYATYANNTLTAHLVNSGKIMAGEGVLLKTTTSGTYSFYKTIDAEAIAGNDLKGTVEDYEITSGDLEEYNFYVLANNGGIGFYRFEGIIPANKAYLRLNKSGEVAAPAINFIVDEENNATSIEAISSLDKALKFIENGRLLIQKDGVVYDALGRVIR